MRPVAALCLTAVMALTLFAGCTKKPKDTTPLLTGLGLADKALTAMNDMYNTWWYSQPFTYTDGGGNVQTVQRNNITKTTFGIPLKSQFDKVPMTWEFAMMAFDMYGYWTMTGDATAQTRMAQQYAFFLDGAATQVYFDGNSAAVYLGSGISDTARVGSFGNQPNVALDDSGWAAMYYIQAYHMTGNPQALKDTRTLILGAYDYFKDGDTANGLWYPQDPPSQGYTTVNGVPGDNRHKSLYGTALIAAALDYLLTVGQANWDSQDQQLYNETLDVYNWMEAHLLRASAGTVDSAGPTGSAPTLPLTVKGGLNTGLDYTVPASYADNLYWCEYNENCGGRTESYGPDGGSRSTLDIKEAGTVSSLGGNMTMAVCHERLYQLTGDVKYLNRAVRTAHALTDSTAYNQNNLLIADRDGWADGSFGVVYAKEVLSLPGIRNADKNLFLNTANAIADKCRVQIGGNWYYNCDWRGTGVWQRQTSVAGMGDPKTIMTSAMSVSMLIAGAIVEQMR
ncbi:MAG: hypothetical protein FWF49_06145 [Oscillospiraceae bacterium]|nr:hypothetical protein [Oscillospiraceae bacterium]